MGVDCWTGASSWSCVVVCVHVCKRAQQLSSRLDSFLLRGMVSASERMHRVSHASYRPAYTAVDITGCWLSRANLELCSGLTGQNDGLVLSRRLSSAVDKPFRAVTEPAFDANQQALHSIDTLPGPIETTKTLLNESIRKQKKPKAVSLTRRR